MICSFNFLIFLAVCLNIFTLINIKILTNSNQQTQSYAFTSHIAAFLSVVLITEMLEICIQTSSDQNVQLILKSYLPVVHGTTIKDLGFIWPGIELTICRTQVTVLTIRIRVITKLPNSEQSYKGKVKTHNYINRQNQSTTGKLWKA